MTQPHTPMSQQQHFVPSRELAAQWSCRAAQEEAVIDNWVAIASKAAQWGADQELEACIAWMAARYGEESHAMGLLHAARRPKAPSLKEQALADLDDVIDRLLECGKTVPLSIRRAIQSIPD